MSDNEFGVGTAGNAKAFGTAVIGDEIVDLIFGDHPHSRSYNNIYARFADGIIEPFSGNRVLISIRIHETNYLKQSGLSGNDVRPGGSAGIFFNGVQVYEFFHRDACCAAIRCYSIVEQLKELPVSLWTDEVVGRKIFYREVPAVVTRFIRDQGALIIQAHGEFKFPPPVWRDEDDDGEDSVDVKEDVLSPHIWWFRN